MISVPGTSGFLVVLAASVTAACSSTSPPEPKPLAPADLAAMPYFDAVEWLETWLVEAEVAGGRVEGYESFDFAAPAEVRRAQASRRERDPERPTEDTARTNEEKLNVVEIHGCEFRTERSRRVVDLATVDRITVVDDVFMEFAYPIEILTGYRNRTTATYVYRARWKFPSAEFAEQAAMVLQRVVHFCVESEQPG